MNNIILCWPTAVVLLTFVDYASFCKTKIMINKIIFLAIDILVILIYAELSGDFPLGDSRQPIYKSLRPFDLVS